MDLVFRVGVAVAAFAFVGLLASRWPGVLLARTPGPVAAACLAAAVGAAAAPGEPTAVPAVDVLLRVGIAVSVTAAASRARRQIWLLTSVLTVSFGTGAALDWLAFAATGATLVMLVLGRRSWLVGALVGAALSQVLLRLDLDGPTGTTAGLAGATAATLIVSGFRRAGPRTRRRLRLAAGTLIGAAVLCTAAAGVAGARAAGDVRDGIDAGEAGLRSIRQANVAQAADRFGGAAATFRRAAVELGRWWARPALAVPVVGQHVRAARSLSRAGEELARAAAAASSEMSVPGLRLTRGAIDISALERAAGAVGSARMALDMAATDVRSVRSPWLSAPVADAIGDVDRRISQARRDVGTAADVLDVAAPMLGRDGPRRYFLAVLTPAENRGSGGLIGNVGEITAERGHLGLTAVDRVAALNEAVDDEAAARVLPPIYAAAYSAWDVAAELQNSTVAADFPTAAEALEAVVPLTGRAPADGTVSVDPLAVAALLEVVGPVTVPSWPVPITTGNAPAVLLHEQYVALAGAARENFLAEVVATVWGRLVSGDLPPPATLARTLGPVVRGRHIQLHSRRSEEQATLGRLGADGVLPRSPGDHLALVTNNAAESKADWFLRRAVEYDVQYDPGEGSVDATVRVTLRNAAPSAGLPAYVLGGRLAPPGHNRQVVQLYTPFDLVTATVDGRPPPAALRSLGQAGNWAHELDLVVPPGGSTVIELRLTGHIEANSGQWALQVGRQPAVYPDNVTVTVKVPEGWRITAPTGGLSVSGRSASAGLVLDQNAPLGAQIERN